MQKLTPTQAKMVIEYFSQQAAQEAPAWDTDTPDWDRHIWMTCYQTSLAVERKISEHDWAVLVLGALDWQSFDRDPEGYLHERGWTHSSQDWMQESLKDVLSASIDTVFNTSKAA